MGLRHESSVPYTLSSVNIGANQQNFNSKRLIASLNSDGVDQSTIGKRSSTNNLNSSSYIRAHQPSTNASTIGRQGQFQRSPTSNRGLNKRRARLLSARPGGVNTGETFDSTMVSNPEAYNSMRQSFNMNMQDSSQVVIIDPKTKSQSMIKIGSMHFPAPSIEKHTHQDSEISSVLNVNRTGMLNSMRHTPKKNKSFTIVVKSKLNRGESQPAMKKEHDQLITESIKSGLQ